MEFRVLGPLEATDGTVPVALGSPKPRALLARLLLDAGRTVSVSQLVDDLWGEAVPESAVKMVQIYVSQLRKALPADVLQTRPPGYALEVEPEAVDVTRFARLREKGRAALAAGDPIQASAVLAEALALWRGPALVEFSEPFARVEGARLEELRLVCLENRIEADVAAGRHADAAGELEALVARHPLREALHGQLMLALYRAGRQAEALAAYDRFRRTLDEQLGIEPSEPLKRLQVRILNQDRDLAPPEAPPARGLPPALAGSGATAFVGRDGDLDRLRAVWERARAGSLQVAMIGGEPGIGKTRLATEFAHAAHADGATVLFGHCDEDLGIPYQPFAEALGAGIEAAPGMQRHQLFETVAARLRAAEAIERVHAGDLDAHAAELALHYGLAGAVADPAVALRWLMRAGELAAAQLAWEDAAAHWDTAVELTPEGEERVALLERLGDLKYAANFDMAGGTAQLEAALAYHERAGDDGRTARLRSRIGRNLTTFYGPVHDVDRGRELLKAAEAVIRSEGDGVPLASVYLGLATAACWAFDVPEVLRTAELAMGIAQRLGNDVLWANAAVLYGNGMTWAGRGEEADTHLEAAWEIGDRLNHPWVPFLATWCGQGDLCWRGEVSRGRRLYERELAKPRTMQAPGQRDYLENLLAWNATLAGDLVLAREIVERSSPDVVPPFAAGILELLAGDPSSAVGTIERWRRVCLESGNVWTAMTYEYDIAQVQWALGDPAVDETYGRIVAAATAGGGTLFELMFRCHVARRLVELGRPDQASVEVERCREIFAAGNRWGAREGDLALAEATVAACAGEDASRGFGRAVEIYAEYGVVWDQAEALQHWAVALSARDPAGAAAMFDRALDLYDRHGASALWRERVLRRRESPAPTP